MLKISLTKLSTKALGDFAVRVLLLLKALVETILKDHPLLADLGKKNAIYQQVVVKKVYSGLGDDVETLDLKRDNAYRGFRRLLKGFLRFESSKSDDARALLEVLDEVGDMEGRKYADQNTMMRKLVEKLSAGENLVRVTRLGLTEELNALKTAQANFESLAGTQNCVKPDRLLCCGKNWKNPCIIYWRWYRPCATRRNGKTCMPSSAS
ncbi:DUF6261 family protein [Limibacterium fermenti]|uniref:DUF6261 family protein n=1 Tax=Limibacterium fermenti TaxID=3229863 RepID=UPI000E9B843E|nr:hypothetical protein [Porphyromonadaceae bacterium]